MTALILLYKCRQAKAAKVEQPKTRPTGVTILAILEIISGIVMVVAGIFAAAFSSMFAGLGVLGALNGILSSIILALGVASFVMAWGLLKGKQWAWTITLILTIISLIAEIASFNFIGIIIDAIILYYLFRPHVKAYFGKLSIKA